MHFPAALHLSRIGPEADFIPAITRRRVYSSSNRDAGAKELICIADISIGSAGVSGRRWADGWNRTEGLEEEEGPGVNTDAGAKVVDRASCCTVRTYSLYVLGIVS